MGGWRESVLASLYPARAGQADHTRSFALPPATWPGNYLSLVFFWLMSLANVPLNLLQHHVFLI